MKHKGRITDTLWCSWKWMRTLFRDGRKERTTVVNLWGVKVRVKCGERERGRGRSVHCHAAGMLWGRSPVWLNHFSQMKSEEAGLSVSLVMEIQDVGVLVWYVFFFFLREDRKQSNTMHLERSWMMWPEIILCILWSVTQSFHALNLWINSKPHEVPNPYEFLLYVECKTCIL